MIPNNYRQLFMNGKIINNNYFILEPGPDTMTGIGNSLKLICSLDTSSIDIGNISYKPDYIDYMCYATEHSHDTDPLIGGIGLWAWLGEADIKLSNNIKSANYTFCGCSLLKKVTITPLNLESANYMFYNNFDLIEINGRDYTNSTEDIDGDVAFNSLKYANYMFYGAGSIGKPTGGTPIKMNYNFPSLISAPGMFIEAYLDYHNAKTLIESLPTYTNGAHSIGITLKNIAEDINDYLQNTATSKGWTLALN